MRLLISRSKDVSLSIGNKPCGHIDNGFLIYVGFVSLDDEKYFDKMIDKVIKLRIFEDENHKMNKNILDVNGDIFLISSFTLFANCKGCNRPSFNGALNGADAKILYDKFVDKFKTIFPNKLELGEFGADMEVSSTNDGPINIIFDSKELYE